MVPLYDGETESMKTQRGTARDLSGSAGARQEPAGERKKKRFTDSDGDSLRSVSPSEVGVVDFLVAEEVFAVVLADLAQDAAGVADGEYLQP